MRQSRTVWLAEISIDGDICRLLGQKQQDS